MSASGCQSGLVWRKAQEDKGKKPTPTHPNHQHPATRPLYNNTKTENMLIVEALTGICCTTSVGLVKHVSRRIFGRRIDLNRFQDLSTEVRRSNLEKTVFWAKNRPFLAVFRIYWSQICLKCLANLVSGTFKCAAQDGVKILSVSMRFVGEKSEKLPKKVAKVRVSRIVSQWSV